MKYEEYDEQAAVDIVHYGVGAALKRCSERDSVIALIAAAAGGAKMVNMSRDEFLRRCNALYMEIATRD